MNRQNDDSPDLFQRDELDLTPEWGLSGYLLIRSPHHQLWQIVVWVLLGLAGWTVVEYVMHRFVLHSLQPFRRWHAAHHRSPRALIGAPTILSASLIGAFVFLPAFALSDAWNACALTLGMSLGYLAYSITHHATHHWHADNAWLKQRKQWHALHHVWLHEPGCYGVTTAFWDRVFGSVIQKHVGR